MDEYQLRLQCIQIVMQLRPGLQDENVVIARAQIVYAYIYAGVTPGDASQDGKAPAAAVAAAN